MTLHRAVVADDGEIIRLAIYRDGDCYPVAVDLTPHRALAVAQDLIAAALPKLPPVPVGSRRQARCT